MRVTVGASGDQSAIALFCAGEIDMAAVARRLTPAERRVCRSSGTRYASAQVAREDIALVVGERNAFVNDLSLDQARSIWGRATPASTWADVDASFPAVPLEPVGWRPDSPPATLMAEALFGPLDPSLRDDYEVFDEPMALTEAVASTPNAIGYLPLAQLRPGSGVRPVQVLPRPLYLDVSAASMRTPATRRFVREYLPSHRIHLKFTRP